MPGGRLPTQKTADLAALRGPLKRAHAQEGGSGGTRGSPTLLPRSRDARLAPIQCDMQALLLFAAALIAAGASPSAGPRPRNGGGGRPLHGRRPARRSGGDRPRSLARPPRDDGLRRSRPVAPGRRLAGKRRPGSLARQCIAGGRLRVHPGRLRVRDARPSDDLLGLAMLGVTFSVVKTLVVRLNAGAASFEPELLSAGAEVALGQPSRSPWTQTSGTPRWSSRCSC